MSYIGKKNGNPNTDFLEAGGELENHDLVNVDASGKVGIGTTSDGAKLKIVSDNGQIGLQTNAGDGSSLYIGNSGSNYFDSSSSGSNIFRTSSTERMRIDSSGRVTMPYQPMFHVYGSGANSAFSTQAVVVNFNSVIQNTGSHYNDTTYRFTAPVDGNYYFSSMVRLDGANTGYFRSHIRKNGSNNYVWGHQINDYGSWSPSYTTFSGSVVYKLSANDYVEVVIESQSDTSWTLYRTESSFYGILLS